MFKYLLIFLLPIFLFAEKEKCTVNTKVMYSILLNESYDRKSVGYQYIISFNNSQDADFVRKSKLNRLFKNSRTLDCLNQDICVNILKQLARVNITNLDLGPYQINFKSHYPKLGLSDFFNLKNSYLYACSYVDEMIDKYGYNWYAISSYHSQTPYYNKIYGEKLKENFRTIKD
jgi:hypothetical protein